MDQIWFAEKNVTLITTDLKGTDVADIYADFKFSEKKSFPVRQVIDPKAMYMTSIHKNAKHLSRYWKATDTK